MRGILAIILPILLTFYFLGEVQNEIAIEKHIWLYWNRDIIYAPTLIQICYNKIKTIS